MRTPQTLRLAAADSLEQRRLLAVDLTVTSIGLAAATPYYTDPSAGVNIACTVRNLGTTAASIGVPVSFFLTKKQKLNIATDIQAGSSFGAALNGKTSTAANTDLSTAEAAPGKYYLAAYVDSSLIYAGQGNPLADANLANNIVFSAEPIVVVVPTLGTPTFSGTPGKDVVKLFQNESHVIVTNNGVTNAIRQDNVGFFAISLGAGADKLIVDASVTEVVKASGNGGNDTLIGGSGDDELGGSGGKDKIYGQGGNDYVVAGGGNDYLEGGAGNDTLSGGSGNDKLVGLAGTDYLLGGTGDDQFYSLDSLVDTLSGGSGTDSGQYDAGDARASIEGII